EPKPGLRSVRLLQAKPGVGRASPVRCISTEKQSWLGRIPMLACTNALLARSLPSQLQHVGSEDDSSDRCIDPSLGSGLHSICPAGHLGCTSGAYPETRGTGHPAIPGEKFEPHHGRVRSP